MPDQYWVFEDAGVIADRFLRGVEYLRESLSVLHADRGALLASQHIVGGGKVGAVAAPKGTGVLFGALTAEMKWMTMRAAVTVRVRIPPSLQTGRARKENAALFPSPEALAASGIDGPTDEGIYTKKAGMETDASFASTVADPDSGETIPTDDALKEELRALLRTAVSELQQAFTPRAIDYEAVPK